MRATTLLEFERDGVPDGTEFLSRHRHLPPKEFRAEVERAYGSPAARDDKLRGTVNSIIIGYLDSESGSK